MLVELASELELLVLEVLDESAFFVELELLDPDPPQPTIENANVAANTAANTCLFFINNSSFLLITAALFIDLNIIHNPFIKNRIFLD